MSLNELFWTNVEQLKNLQMNQFAEIFSQARSTDDRSEDQGLRVRCISMTEEIVENVIENLVNGAAPVFRIPKKPVGGSMTKSGENFVSAGNPRSVTRFVHMMDLLSKSYVLISTNSRATLRDIFYENVTIYEKQSNLDRAVEDISRMLTVPRRTLHITATRKGLIGGHLSFVTKGGTRVQVEEAEQGVMIPEDVRGLSSITSRSRFILIIEKDATFQRLIETHFLRVFGPCILVTGKGYPDLITRQMVHRMWTQLQIPVFALVDADPFGLHIAAVYKFGALARDEPNLRINGLTLLGILPSELQQLELPATSLVPLSPRDYGKLASLEAHPAIKQEPSWLVQIQCLRDLGLKAEIQTLTHIDPNFLSTVYLPSKISSGSWIA